MSKAIVRILLLFMVGLMSSSLLYLPTIIIETFFLPPPIAVVLSGQVKTYYETAHPVLLPAIYVFGQLFGILLALKWLREKSNYLYLFLTTVLLTVIFLLIKNLSNTLIIQFSPVISSLVLTLTANHFIKKQTSNL